MIELIHLQKKYENAMPLKDVNAVINDGDVISVIGPSGTGKSTLLRCINMLERPTGGQIIFNGEDITAPKYDLTMAEERYIIPSLSNLNEGETQDLSSAAVSKGQAAALEFVSLSTMLLLGYQDEITLERAMQDIDYVFEDDFDLSVYMGVNRGAFRNGVAITSRSLIDDVASEENKNKAKEWISSAGVSLNDAAKDVRQFIENEVEMNEGRGDTLNSATADVA